MTACLFIGGARSGKSRYAEQQALALLEQRLSEGAAARLHYVATAIAFDREMQQRIELHQQRRGPEWCNHESPVLLAQTLAQFQAQDVVLVDCLTLWLNNVIYNEGETATVAMIEQQVQALVDVLKDSPATILCVSNEVGLGIVPMGEVSRLYVDHAGWMNQAIAAVAEQVTFMAAGLPMQLKGR
ncbi:bifunctional adenosylcobinamide kinase/adenosylcobinamide-phosphate guanylyltransferase [Vibrio mangrovi]|uniref:Bifunctional adenosylcobalamin biosynthesis protein n=1 Tax=Vibrio mangrovi TaxID=474394 RepID=A0A1Y6IN03_9VIBR|nr:bifunctional adenosylcobinamide kinase/adenosylcobinamide-phosphate guanylyltransferase [Vibrio mangrovi]MDW6004176.1 bifunctional adenosylcobinamide kinase/adenosylcobinamide-phosphate guanylyltransferase [Vibrio mangrovi]SMR99027.1 Bifunctional adenosylcobalamin biosynthesis protein CobP [Vibrio mangrovi]